MKRLVLVTLLALLLLLSWAVAEDKFSADGCIGSNPPCTSLVMDSADDSVRTHPATMTFTLPQRIILYDADDKPWACGPSTRGEWRCETWDEGGKHD